MKVSGDNSIPSVHGASAGTRGVRGSIEACYWSLEDDLKSKMIRNVMNKQLRAPECFIRRLYFHRRRFLPELSSGLTDFFSFLLGL